MKKIVLLFTMVMLCFIAGCGECQHEEWSEADCVTAKTCINCGMTDGEPLGHSELEWEVNTDNTTDTCVYVEGTCPECYELVETKERNYVYDGDFGMSVEEFVEYFNALSFTVNLVESENGSYRNSAYEYLEDEESYFFVKFDENDAGMITNISFTGHGLEEARGYLITCCDLFATVNPQYEDYEVDDYFKDVCEKYLSDLKAEFNGVDYYYTESRATDTIWFMMETK